jgi:Arylsulfotransferase (ASST)
MLSARALMIGATALVGFASAAATTADPTTATAATAAGSHGPLCTPTTLDASAMRAGSVTVSPMPGSRDASPQTQISFLGVPAGDLSHIEVIGSHSGAHSGRLVPYSQGDGASFLPSTWFWEGERVTVRADVRAGRAVHPLVDEFAVANEDPITTTPDPIHAGTSNELQSFRSRPDLRPPVVTVTTQSPAVAPGDEFIAPYAGPGPSGPMILDPSGAMIWFKPLPAHISATNLEVQEYAGRPVLTWWQGDISVHGFGLGEDVIADQTYTDIAHVRAGNGLRADLHEFQLTPQGTALITVYDPILCDLSSVGGPADGAVIDSLLQEIDVKTGLVMFQWSSLDHVALSESYEPASRSTVGSPFDFFHINSISRDHDESLLISGRNTWATYDLDARSGQISWRLGGRRSSFKLDSGASTAWQHDSRELPDGSISIFDNGAAPKVHPQSRGIVLDLDAHSKTATLATQIIHTPAVVAESQGDMQALENGDWFLGWGQIPEFSEFSAGGQLLFNALLPPQTQSYRAFRFTWTGTPVHPPTFAFQAVAGGGGTVYASWNGATLAIAWRVLSGSSPTQLTPIAQVPRTGFETAIPVPPGIPGPYITVQALDAAGAVIGTAQTTSLAG